MPIYSYQSIGKIPESARLAYYQVTIALGCWSLTHAIYDITV
jgi:hypothetical protein